MKCPRTAAHLSTNDHWAFHMAIKNSLYPVETHKKMNIWKHLKKPVKRYQTVV